MRAGSTIRIGTPPALYMLYLSYGCDTRLTPSFGTCALQLVDGPLEVLQILEILVDAGEAHVRHHVQVTQRLENRLADLIRFDLGQSS